MRDDFFICESMKDSLKVKMTYSLDVFVSYKHAASLYFLSLLDFFSLPVMLECQACNLEVTGLSLGTRRDCRWEE